MEIGDQRVHAAKPVAGVDKDIRVARMKGCNLAGGQAGGLQERTAVVPTATTRPPRARVSRTASQAPSSIDLHVLRVHDMVLDLIRAHRLEGARPHVQGDHCPSSTPRRSQPWASRSSVKCRPGGGGRHRALPLGVDRLVALAIGQPIRRSI